MQAIILAAGMGKRLKDLTKDNTKCMVKVNGITLIERMLKQIDSHNLNQIVMVVGYEGQKLKDYIASLGVRTPIVFIDNPIYDKTNNIYSLFLAKEWLCKDDTLLLESDLVFEDSVLDIILDDDRKTLALVDHYESWMDGTCVTINEDDGIESFVPNNVFKYNEVSSYYKTVNIYKFGREFSEKVYVPFLEAYQSALGRNEYYEQVLRVIAMLDSSDIKVKRLDGEKWYEIDDMQDLDIAESIFASSDDEKVDLLNKRYGGYWRYPRLLDFCYLVNPYFPPQRMKEEIKANFDTLLTEYPSGQHINSLLAGKNFGVKEDNILVGNGAAELIKSLMNFLDGVTGFIRPTFEEYPNRYDGSNSVDFVPDNEDYSYTAEDIIEFFSDKDINNLIVINPDNPSGNYIPKADLLKLIEWSANRKIKLIIDESFADFSDELDNTLIVQDILNDNPHLFVMKSISKSYGVPGIRLGVLASGDSETITKMKKDVAIWNINSFGEFYLQIEEKYHADYEQALVRFRKERDRFQKELSQIRGVRVIPSQANFVMVELADGISPKELLKQLLVKYDLLIKELTTKTNGRNYLRLAIRNSRDNDALVSAMKAELE